MVLRKRHLTMIKPWVLVFKIAKKAQYFRVGCCFRGFLPCRPSRPKPQRGSGDLAPQGRCQRCHDHGGLCDWENGAGVEEVEDFEILFGLFWGGEASWWKTWTFQVFLGLVLLSPGLEVYKYDVSLPLPRMYELVEETRQKLRDAGFEVAMVHQTDPIGRKTWRTPCSNLYKGGLMEWMITGRPSGIAFGGTRMN